MKCRPSAIIIRDDSLLTMRYMYGETEVFALPGGNPDPGECLTTTLKRELWEEMGITVETDKLAFCGEVLWTEQKRDTLHMVYLAKIIEGVPVLNPKETTALEIAWLPLASLNSRLMYPNIGKHIQEYLQLNTSSPYIGVIDQPYIR